MKQIFTTIILIAILVVAVGSNSQAQQKSPVVAGLMSTVLPGLGQFYTHQPSKGLYISATYLGALGLVIATGPGTWEDEKSGDPYFSDLAQGTGTSGTTKIIWYSSVAVAGGVLIYSVIDAVKKSKQINEKNKSFGFAPYIDRDTYGVQLSLNF